MRYPSANAITANEIHVPVGRDLLIGVETADVIHDFWAPRLGRKIDAIPGTPQLRSGFAPMQPGEYRGRCAEFCGAEHAWMRFRVVAQNRGGLSRHGWPQQVSACGAASGRGCGTGRQIVFASLRAAIATTFTG